jgi:hypothetical protein
MVAPQRDQPAHYRTIGISLYTDDLARLDALVAELRQRGHHKMTRSALIRAALDQVATELDRVPTAR